MTLLEPYHRGKTESPETSPVCAVVLAAGAAQRFGGGKLHALYRGRPLLSHVLSIIEAACKQKLLARAHVVVASHDERTSDLVRNAGHEALQNDSPQMGLSYSLQLCLAALETAPAREASAALIFLADQPLVRLDVIDQLVKAWHQGSAAVIRPRYEARRSVPGHPVLLARPWWSQAHQLAGDEGFGALLDPRSPDMLMLDVVGDNPDVDTEADLKSLEKTHP